MLLVTREQERGRKEAASVVMGMVGGSHVTAQKVCVVQTCRGWSKQESVVRASRELGFEGAIWAVLGHWGHSQVPQDVWC